MEVMAGFGMNHIKWEYEILLPSYFTMENAGATAIGKT